MALEWTPTRFAVGDFDSAKRYVRSGSGGYALATGETIKMVFNGVVSGTTFNQVTWHFAIPGYMDRSYIRLRTAFLGATEVNSDPGTPTPTVVAVKT